MCTITDNKLIAEFIGYDTKQLNKGVARLEENKYVWGQTHYNIDSQWYKEDELRYHDDWNWLIKAVDKIEEIEDNEGFCQYVFEILMTSVNIVDNRYPLPIVETFERTKIEATYKAIIEFIKYYNNEN
jgi:hypothetical protein